jgi:drug/metabolite transporter (DMT)-like permease
MTASAWPSRRVLAQYAALALSWGASFFFIKVALHGLSPAEVVLGRLGAGAVTLLAVTVMTRQPLPRQPVIWAHLAAVGALLLHPAANPMSVANVAAAVILRATFIRNAHPCPEG